MSQGIEVPGGVYARIDRRPLEDSADFSSTRRRQALFRTISRSDGSNAKGVDSTAEGDGRHGLVERKVFAQVPPKVVYSLTPLGRSLKPVVDAMCRWGDLHGSSATAWEAQS